jgi:hypothetical protein
MIYSQHMETIKRRKKRMLARDAIAVVTALATEKTKKQALIKAGYSPATAEHSTTRTERLAVERVKELAEEGNETAQTALLAVISRDEIVTRLRYLALESNSDAVSLSALKPFSKAIGIDYDDKPAEKLAPPIQIGIINTPNLPPNSP